MNLNKETESKVKTFSPKEEANCDSSVKSDFLKNITDKFLKKSGKCDITHLCNDESQYKKSVKLLWEEFRAKIISTVVTMAVIIAICAVVNIFDWSLGYEVIVDGENIGLVTDRQIVYDAIDEVRGEIKMYLGQNKDYEKEPAFVRRLVSEKSLTDKEGIKTTLLSNVDSMVEGYGIYINGQVILGVSTREAADWVFATYKKMHLTEEVTEGVSVDFCENVEVKKEFLHIALLETPEEAVEILSGGRQELTTHTVKRGDSLWKIAEKYDTTVEHILAINDPAVTQNLQIGSSVCVEEAVPMLSIRTIRTVSLTEPVPFEVEEIKDDSMYEGRTLVERDGQEGTAKVLARVTTVNGVQTQKEVIESETVTPPVNQIVKVGTKERPPTTGSGSFINPTYGVLSSRYGARWGKNHDGVDISGEYNSDIKAADGGVVIYADWMSGYGNYVVIDHENGYQTAYGHCASMNVSVGDRVVKGKVIAKMGNTGRTSGTHLHFEVRYNGEYVNPLEYIGY